MAEGRFEGVLAEAFGRQIPRRPRPDASTLHEPAGPACFGLQFEQGGFCQARGYALPGEIVPDRRIAEAAAGECLGAVAAEATVVDEPCACQGLERLLLRRRRDPGTLQAVGQPALGQIVCPQSTTRDPERLCAAQFATQKPQRLAVEGASLSNPGPNHDVRRQEAPR